MSAAEYSHGAVLVQASSMFGEAGGTGEGGVGWGDGSRTNRAHAARGSGLNAVSGGAAVTRAPPYLLVTQESAGGDTWHDYDSTVATSTAAAGTAAVWGRGPGDWHTVGTGGQSYAPVDLKYLN